MAGEDRGIAHSDQRFIAVCIAAGIAAGFHAEVNGRFPAVHVSHQHTVLDEQLIAGRRALVIHVYRQRRTASVRQGMGKIHHGDQVAGHPFAKAVGRHRAAQHQVGLYGVSHRLVRQDPGQIRRQYNIFQPGAGKDALPLLHQRFHHLIQLGVVLGGVGEIVGQDPLAAAQHVKELHRHAVGGFRGQSYHEVRPRANAVAVGAVADQQQFFHAVVAQHNGAAGQLRIFFLQVIIYRPHEFHIVLLGHIDVFFIQRCHPAGKRRQGGAALLNTGIQKQSVFLCRPQNPAHAFLLVLHGAGKAVNTVAVHAGANAALLRPDIGEHTAVEHPHGARRVHLRAQLHMSGQLRRKRRKIILQHNESSVLVIVPPPTTVSPR